MISNPKFCPQCGTVLELKPLTDRVRPVCPACGFIFYLNPPVAAGALVEHEGKVALVLRGVEPGRERWGLPAGYVEADESAEEAAVRETWEETRLRVEVDGLLEAFSYGREQNRGVLLIYAAHLVLGELVAGDDALDAKWFGPDELPDIAFRTHREVLHKWRQARAVLYRPATLADAEVAATLEELDPLKRRGDYTRFVTDPEQRLFVAVDQGQVVGFGAVILEPHRRIARIEQIFVHPHYRRWGIGTHLIATCTAFGRERGVQAVVVEVSLSTMAWTVYLKAGFHVSGFTSDYHAPGSNVAEPALILTWDAHTGSAP